MVSPQQHEREEIDRLLRAAGWAAQDCKRADLHASRGVALREFPLPPGHGLADSLLYMDGNLPTPDVIATDLAGEVPRA